MNKREIFERNKVEKIKKHTPNYNTKNQNSRECQQRDKTKMLQNIMVCVRRQVQGNKRRRKKKRHRDITNSIGFHLGLV